MDSSITGYFFSFSIFRTLSDFQRKWILSPLFMICFGLFTAWISDYLVSAATAFSLKKQKNSFV